MKSKYSKLLFLKSTRIAIDKRLHIRIILQMIEKMWWFYIQRCKDGKFYYDSMYDILNRLKAKVLQSLFSRSVHVGFARQTLHIFLTSSTSASY